ncbi:hypothetical protein MRB53_041292 [Persea americana]|nr:hypothetical protein MRB53_041292 [Persea americana]
MLARGGSFCCRQPPGQQLAIDHHLLTQVTICYDLPLTVHRRIVVAQIASPAVICRHNASSVPGLPCCAVGLRVNRRRCTHVAAISLYARRVSAPTTTFDMATDLPVRSLTDEQGTWSVYGKTRTTIDEQPLSEDELRKTTEYFHASLYLCLGMLYLKQNPLLREPLKKEHIKPRLLGHWGSDAGQSFTYIHMNRLVKKYDLDAFVISGPGHGAPGLISNFYLEGTYSDFYPSKGEDAEGMQAFFKQFSFPGGVGSHMTPETPGSIHEGGELGYSLSHAFGAVYDHPKTIALTIVGDGESETGPLATSWHSNKFLNPITDGAVLPVLHLNGYKINNPTILARISEVELVALMKGYGWTPYFVEGSDLDTMHQAMAGTLEHCVKEIRKYQKEARESGKVFRPHWPMIVLRSPKGWTAPRKVDGHYLEGFWRAHQIPLTKVLNDPEQLGMLEKWMRSYNPEKLFGKEGKLIPELRELAPAKGKRMGMSDHCCRIGVRQ